MENPIADYVRSRPHRVLPNGEPIKADDWRSVFKQAERLGVRGLENTYKDIRKKYHTIEDLTAINVCINWLSWESVDNGDDEFGRWYADKYNEMREEILMSKGRFTKVEKNYYIITTD